MPYRKPLLRFLVARVDGRQPLPAWWLWIGMGCVGVGLVLRVALSPLLHANLPYITFYPALIVAGVWGGTRAGLVALVLSAFIGGYFWLPEGQLTDSAVVVGLYLTMGALILMVTSTLRRAVSEYRDASERATVLAQEMRHRIYNLLAVVMAISNQTAKTARTVEQYRADLGDRLLALARAQRLIASDEAATGSTLRDLITAVLEPFGNHRFALSGPEMMMPKSIAPNLALLFNELATNATKHGALSKEQGEVSLHWQPSEDGTITMEWKEHGGPVVAEPQTIGFGSFLLRAAFAPDQGSVERSFEPDGTRCVITLKTPALDTAGPSPASAGQF